MNYTDKITRIIVDMYKPNGPKNKNNVDVYDMSDSFNARVGDEQIPLMIEYRERGIIERMTSESLTPFAMGYVGQPDEHGKVTAETGVAVSYHGSSDDIIGAGKVKMDLPGAMFPQEGMFYGFFGLENSAGKRITSNDVCFEVKNGNPDMYVDSMPFRSELQKLLDEAVVKADTTIGDIKANWEALRDTILEMIKQGNIDLDSYLSRLKLAEDRLNQYEKDLADGKGIKQADLDAALADLKNDVQDGLDELDKLGEGLVDVPDIDGGIPDYNINPLQKLSAQIDTSKFNLGFGTDYHYDLNTDYSTFTGFTSEDLARNWKDGLRKSLNILSLSDKLDALVFNGDNTDSPHISDTKTQHDMMIKQNRDFANAAFRVSKCPTFIMKGNHDNNYYMADVNRLYERVLHDADFQKIYHQDGSFGEKRLSGSNYYYKDFPDKKVRLIGLDSSDFPEATDENGLMIFDRMHNSAFQQEQLNWLANEALQAPNDYAVLITMHWPVNHTVYDYDDNIMINHNILKTILEDFVAGCDVKELTSSGDVPVDIKYQFKNKGTLVGVLSGHRHLDQQVTIDGINYVLTRCSLTTGDNMIAAKRMSYEGTSLEDAFDIVTVDTTAKTLTMTRFGAGSEDQRYAIRTMPY